MSKEAIWKWRPLMWLMPLLIGLTMFIVVMPAQASADEHQSWISSWDSPAAAWEKSDENGANYYTAAQPVALTDGVAVITYTTDGGKTQPTPEILDADKGTVEGVEVTEVDNNYVRTATISNLEPDTTYMLHWAGGNIIKLPKDLYLTFTTKSTQNWITWGTPAATWTGSDETGADYYEANDVVAFTEDEPIVINYSVNGGKQYAHAKIQSATGGEVEGASVEELDVTERTATITGLAPGTQYRLHWAAAESNGKLQHDVYLTFTTEESETTVTEPVQNWITFESPEVEWKQFKDDADWYQTKDKMAFVNEGNVVINYSVNGGKQYAHARIQSATGGEVGGASVEEPDATERTATITGLAPGTQYRLHWAASESNGKLEHDVYLTFTTISEQSWLTWVTPDADWSGNDNNGADIYTAKNDVEFEDDDSVIITYKVDGGRQYGRAQIQDANGNSVGETVYANPDNQTFVVTITGLAQETTYRLYWDKDKVNQGGRPHLDRDVYLTFTTGSIDPEALRVIGVKEKYEYTGSEITPEFTVKVGDATLTEGTDYEVTYEGERVNAGGSVTMTVTGKEGTPYEGKSKEKQFNIAKAQITSECVALPKGAGVAADGTVQYTYTGSEIKPAPVVTVNGRELERGTDYALTYADDADFVNVESGKVLTITVAATSSNYNGGATVKYTIVPKSITPSVALSKTSYTYSGKAIAPAETVKAGTKALKKGTDYTVSYTTTHKTVGKHGVKVTLKGNYKGTRTATFKILPKKAAVSKATVGKKKVTVKLKTKVSATGGSTYQIAYRVKGTSKWKYTTTTKQSKTIKKLKKGKKYQIKARAYKTVSKVKYYGAWSKTVTTKKVK